MSLVDGDGGTSGSGAGRGRRSAVPDERAAERRRVVSLLWIRDGPRARRPSAAARATRAPGTRASMRAIRVATVVSAANGTVPVTDSIITERERVHVGLAVDRLALGLLRRGVPRRAEHDTGRLGPRGLGDRASEPEVGDAEPALLVEEEVRGLDVAMHEAPTVRVLEATGGLEADDQRLRRCEQPTGVEHRPAGSRRRGIRAPGTGRAPRGRLPPPSRRQP